MTTRKRAPWLAAAALSLSLGPAAASAQDPTQNRTGNDPFDVGGPDTALDELGGETQRQLEEQRRRREEDDARAADDRRALIPDASDFDLTPGPNGTTVSP